MKILENINPNIVNSDFNIQEGIKYSLLPGELDGKNYLFLPKDKLENALNFYSKQPLKWEIIATDLDSFNRLLNQYIDLKTQDDLSEIEEIEEDYDLEQEYDILQENSAPIIKFVNSIFFQAIKKRASDIHIETHENFGLIRFRIDGVLITQKKIPKNIVNLVINRIKVISNLDISENKRPQDGRTHIKISGKTTDIRVSIIPTYYGEKAVMRLLMQSEDIPSLKELGFNDEINRGFKELLSHSYGMILVTGPTGSGKSTTLHSFLQTIATPEKNIITIEDPVEYKADNINQIQVNPKVGLTFSTGLRSILRQDPDIIMVGEIRDKETATIAIQAALTGHLMLSTLHTNTALGAITRLMDMGIAPYLIASSLIGVLSQRLVRLLCSCKIKEDNKEILEEFEKIAKKPLKNIYKPKGCKECNFTGYKSRIAVGELLIIDDKLKELIAKGANETVLKDFSKNKSLKENLIELITSGKTSIQEAIRVGLKD